MFLLQLGKEMKVFFTSKGNLMFIFVMPLLLITVFSFALKDYINADYGTFEKGKLFYYLEKTDSSKLDEFESIKEKMTASLGIVFEQVSDYEKAVKDVEASKGYGVITVKTDGYDYFRSGFNEPEGGKLARTLFIQMTSASGKKSEEAEGISINKVVLDVSKVDSKNYYTFAGLAFSILFMGLLVAFSIYDEREYGTIERIKLSNAGIPSMIFSKALTGIISGAIMIGTAYLYSRFILDVNWGSKTAFILLILLCLVIYSAVFGCMVGLVSKNKTMCQSTVLMTSMLCGYLGGSITPLYLLENMPLLNWLIKISPLYWTNRAIISLYNGIVDEKTTYSIIVLLGLTAVFIMLGIKAGKKVVKKA